jgi:hypothetical protein
MADLLRAFWTRVTDIHEQEWGQISTAAVAGVAVFAVLVLYYTHSGSHWLFPVDNANLAFHEFGHPFFGAFHRDLGVYGGTLGQLVFPTVTTVIFWVRREAASCAVCAIWFFENLFNIARYMADARAHQLPLVGGLNPDLYHDWSEIFVRWHQLQHDTAIAAFTGFIGWVGVLGTMLWLAYLWYGQDRVSQRQDGQ